MALRHQQVIIANVYRQDFLLPGLHRTVQLALQRRSRRRFITTTTAFWCGPRRSARLFLTERSSPHSIHAAYLGWTGDGHIGRVNLTHAFYQALGTDSFNPIAGRPVTHQCADGARWSFRWIKIGSRFKVSPFYASGSAIRATASARGFDCHRWILRSSRAEFSACGIARDSSHGNGRGFDAADSLLPSLRSNKDEGQANFVNPGIFLRIWAPISTSRRSCAAS